jgi:hypothetical protein
MDRAEIKILLNWIYELQLKNIDFEPNSINIVTRFYSKKRDVFEFGDEIRDCLHVYIFHFRNVRVNFIKRQINTVINILTKVVTFIIGFHIFIDILRCTKFFSTQTK